MISRANVIELMKKPVFWVGFAAWTVGGYFLARSYSTKRKASLTPALKPDAFVPLRLISSERVSHNTSKFRFAFPNDQQLAGYNVASCLLVKATCGVLDKQTGVKTVQDVIRPYTPTSSPDARGYLELVIKQYPDGPMSNHIFNLKVGDQLLFKGPIAKIKYETNAWSHIGMIAGGTGITPMLQVIHRALSDPADKTKVTLVFGNISSDDILLKKELDALAGQYPDRFKVHYTLDKPTESWKGFRGFITSDMLKEAGLPNASDDKVMVMVCGSSGMLKHVCGDKNPDKSQGEVDPNSVLGKLGFTKDKVFKF
jgi:cytochrome-b5 reductase